MKCRFDVVVGYTYSEATDAAPQRTKRGREREGWLTPGIGRIGSEQTPAGGGVLLLACTTSTTSTYSTPHEPLATRPGDGGCFRVGVTTCMFFFFAHCSSRKNLGLRLYSAILRWQ